MKYSYHTATVEDIENNKELFYNKKKVTAEIISLSQTRYVEERCTMTDIHYNTKLSYIPGLVELSNGVELDIDNFDEIEQLETRT